jgi:broad specificity polyphosphatase/5'/3'-nucleotidase SurE
MQILLTNDDGANATGLEVLERIADGYLSEMPLHLDLADAPSLSGLCA